MSFTFPQHWSRLRVVLCHDWLTGMRGGERVLEILCQAFPEAPIYTLIHHRSAISETINRHPIQASWLQRLPGIEKRYRHLLPLFPAAIQSFDPPEADLLISTSHCVAKSIRTRPGTPHLCYCFTPMRYAWLFHDEYLGNPVKRLLAKPLLAWLRRWDRATASRVTNYVAISRHVQDRIARFYGRESAVIHPPVDLDRWTPDYREPRGYDLIASALVPYKKLDLAVTVYTRSGYPLRIVGVGTEMDRLRALSGPNIEFLGWQSDERLLELYRGCRALIFPGEEDFGIVPLEAQACGRPVVAFGKGGALETVKAGVSGVFFDTQTPDALAAAIAESATQAWDSPVIRAHSETFGIPAFIAGMDVCLRKTLHQSTP
jgi:glycosyltransferase involved in cell wall biosynthesis